MLTRKHDTELTLADLRARAEAGDRFALLALHHYRSDEELQTAIRASRAADYTS